MDPETIKGLIQKANEARKRAADIQEEHHKDGKWATAEAKSSFDAAIDDAMKMKDEADTAVEQFERERKAAGFDAWASKSAGLLPGMAADRKSADEGVAAASEGARASGRPAVEYKAIKGDAVEVYHPKGSPRFKAEDEVAYTDVFRRYLAAGVHGLSGADYDLAEQKALSVGTDAAGGALVMSEVMYAKLIETLQSAVLMRTLGTVLPPLTTAASMAIGTAGELDDATWTSELATGSDDTSTPFGARALRPSPLAKRVKISKTLLRLPSLDTEAWVRNAIAQKFAKAEESAFMNGNGVNQPLGVFQSSLPTIVTAASATDIAYLDLVAVEFSLATLNQGGASWIGHRTIIKELFSLLDGNGRPLLRDVPSAGVKYSLMNYDLNLSEYAPSASTTGAKVLALGNWKEAYYIVDTLGTTVERLDQLYAEANQMGYIARKETDGMLVDGQSVSILQMA